MNTVYGTPQGFLPHIVRGGLEAFEPELVNRLWLDHCLLDYVNTASPHFHPRMKLKVEINGRSHHHPFQRMEIRRDMTTLPLPPHPPLLLNTRLRFVSHQMFLAYFESNLNETFHQGDSITRRGIIELRNKAS